MERINRQNSEIYEAIGSALDSLSTEKTYECLSQESVADLPMPSTDKLREIVRLCREVTFPGFFAKQPVRQSSLRHYLGMCIEELGHKLNAEIYACLCQGLCQGLCREICQGSQKYKDAIAHTSGPVVQQTLKLRAETFTADFIRWLKDLRRLMNADVEAIQEGDPAAKSKTEIIMAYPAVRAISSYRIAHKLHELDIPLIPRVITEMAHSETGIDINPEAVIGERFSIDHGTGVVIGATCVIGNNVKIYQGVTLGAKCPTSTDKTSGDYKTCQGRRHPQIEDNVVIYSQATILGPVTIGHDSVIGGNVWITHDVEPNSRIAQREYTEE